MSPGRNDPCPCGSGRKFKRCHGASAELAPNPTDADREQAYELLASLVNLPRFTEDVDDAHDMIAGLDGVSDDVIRETAGGSLFLEWLWLDYILHTGGSLAQFALGRHERDLTPGGRRFLRACLDAPMRLLQVTRVEPGVRVEVKDLLDRGPAISVSERSGSGQMDRHDVFVGRIVAYEGDSQFEGTAIRIPILDKPRLIRGARRLRKLLAEEFPDPVPPPLTRMATGAALVIEVLNLFQRPMPRLQTTDGDELAFANVRFDIVNAPAVNAALESAPDLERDTADDQEAPAYSWFESESGTDIVGRRVLGRVVLRSSTLLVETMSMARARRAQQYFGAIARDALQFVAIDVSSLDEVRRRAEARPPAPEIDPAIAGPIERRYMEAHYRAWMDEPVPALGNRTPRAAASEKYWRPKVLDLIKGIENQAARSAREGKGFDVAFLRSELGFLARR